MFLSLTYKIWTMCRLFFKNKRHRILPHLYSSHLEGTHIISPRALNPKENLSWSLSKLEITGFTSVPVGGGVAVILILQQGKKKNLVEEIYLVRTCSKTVYSHSTPCLHSFEVFLSRQGFRNFLTLHAHSHLGTRNQESLNPKSQSKSVAAASRTPERWRLLKVSALKTHRVGIKICRGSQLCWKLRRLKKKENL